MKNMKKTIGILIFIILITIVTNVNAASFDVNLLATKTTIEPEDETTITIRLTNVDMGSNGIKSLAGYLEYDETKFETVSSISGMGTAPWSWSYNSEDGKFAGIILSQGATSTVAIGTIKLKAKENAAEGTTTVTLRDVQSSDGLTDISTANATTSITIKKVEEVVEPEEPEENDSNTNTNNNELNNNTSNNANTEHAKAGKSETITVILTTLIVLSIVGYKMYSKYQGI